MKILVTGGAGFIGSHLVDALIEADHSVVVVDNLSTGKRENLNYKAKFFQVDIANNDLRLDEVFREEGIEFVYHLAAAAKIPWCIKHPFESHKINVNATLKLLELSKEFKVKGFVFSSSSSVYGELPPNIYGKESAPVSPISVYGLQKYTSEQYAKYYAQYLGVPTASLRYFNVYGTSRQSPDGPYPNVFTAFYRDRKEKGTITIYGDGHQMRDFVHVHDVVQANLACLKKPLTGDIFNVGTGKSTAIDVIAMYFDCAVNYTEKREGDPLWSGADIAYIDHKLNWKPTIDLKKGLEIFFNSYK
jgi:UDP-glucose 4-epimerase